MPGMLGGPTAPERQKAPVVVELMEARTSKKRTGDDETGGENHNLNVLYAASGNPRLTKPF